jgi:hypothetical protein
MYMATRQNVKEGYIICGTGESDGPMGSLQGNGTGDKGAWTILSLFLANEH